MEMFRQLGDRSGFQYLAGADKCSGMDSWVLSSVRLFVCGYDSVNALWESGPVERSIPRGCEARIRGEDRQIGWGM